MPLGMDELKNLQFLRDLMVRKDSEPILSVLKNMEYMSELGISGLDNAADDKMGMILVENKKLKGLHLSWSSTLDKTDHTEKDETVLSIWKGLPSSTIEASNFHPGLALH